MSEPDELETGCRQAGPMSTAAKPTSLVLQAEHAAISAAEAAGVRVADEQEMELLNDVEDLLVNVWGTESHSAPIPADLLRSIGHAGCNITAAYNESGVLCGAAVAIVTPDRSVYSLIAGVASGAADAGVGFALKQHQRAWALARGLETMVWTFDPLVSRNARFNLTKLGARAFEYIPNFYGPMHDGINANDESDRLVAVWSLTSQAAIDASVGETELVELPQFGSDHIRETGPDGAPFVISVAGELWCRVPTDIIEVRRNSPAEAAAWRNSVRGVFTAAITSGHTANGVTRSGWYRLVTEGLS